MPACQCNLVNKIAAIQMNSSDSKKDNLETVARLVEEAAFIHKAGLVLLPENFALFDGKAALDLGLQESEVNGDIRGFISSLAKKYSIWIIAGSIPCASRPDKSLIDGRVRSACWVFDDTGVEVSRYDKIHLFDVDVDDSHGSYRESRQFEAGITPQMVDTPAGKIGLSICYDLRFPQLYSWLAGAGAQILTVPAAFTFKTGEAHWELLLRARAVENQCYVIAANQTGVHSKGRETWGHSMIIDPWGKIVACAEDGEGVISAEINLQALSDIRSAMPVLKHRKLIK
jgi:deaminated glutathione amidase